MLGTAKACGIDPYAVAWIARGAGKWITDAIGSRIMIAAGLALIRRVDFEGSACLERNDRVQLPTAQNPPAQSVIVQQPFTFSDRQFVSDKPDESMPNIEQRITPLCSVVVGILRQRRSSQVVHEVRNVVAPGIADSDMTRLCRTAGAAKRAWHCSRYCHRWLPIQERRVPQPRRYSNLRTGIRQSDCLTRRNQSRCPDLHCEGGSFCERCCPRSSRQVHVSFPNWISGPKLNCWTYGVRSLGSCARICRPARSTAAGRELREAVLKLKNRCAAPKNLTDIVGNHERRI